MKRRAFLSLCALASAGVALDPTIVLEAPRAPITLIEWARRMDPTGKHLAIVEFLAQTNELLGDMVWVER